MNETLKAMERRRRDPRFAERYFVGHGIDIGCGPDPLGTQKLYRAWPAMLSCDEWDQEDGDAQVMEGVEPESYDFVYASHLLEHVIDPLATLKRWWEILKPGGHLILVVPDEDMYEQGVWPPTFNTDHKHTYAIGKKQSWSPVSKNVEALLSELGGEIVKVERIDYNYVPGAARFDQTSARISIRDGQAGLIQGEGISESCIEAIVRKPK